MGFERHLLQEVFKFEFLFDPDVAEYKNTILKDQTWKEIAARIGVSDEMCKKRFCSINEAYRKISRCMDLNTGSDALDSKQLKYIKLVVFFDNMMSIIYNADYIEKTPIPNSAIISTEVAASPESKKSWSEPMDICEFLDMAIGRLPECFSSAEKSKIKNILFFKTINWRFDRANLSPEKRTEMGNSIFKDVADKTDEF